MYFSEQNAFQSARSKLGERVLAIVHARIMLESSAIVNDGSSVVSPYSSYFGMSLFVPGAVFGDVGR